MRPNKLYFYFTILFILVMPVLSMIIDNWLFSQDYTLLQLIGKWFVFWAIGLRLFNAGFKQTINPAFTLEKIFHIRSKESQVIVRELGFANICFGLLGVLSLFAAQFRLPAAIAGGLYMGLAGVYHIIKKPVSTNEVIAMVSDIFIFIIMLFFVLGSVL
jgi:hypothetical protein